MNIVRYYLFSISYIVRFIFNFLYISDIVRYYLFSISSVLKFWTKDKISLKHNHQNKISKWKIILKFGSFIIKYCFYPLSISILFSRKIMSVKYEKSQSPLIPITPLNNVLTSMTFDMLDTSYRLSFVCLHTAKMFRKCTDVVANNPFYYHTSLILRNLFLSFLFFFLFFSFSVSPFGPSLFLSISSYCLRLQNNRHSEEVFDEIKTKYQIESVVWFSFYPLFDLFLLILLNFPNYYFST